MKHLSNLEAHTSKLLENLVEMFPRSYIEGHIINRFKYIFMNTNVLLAMRSLQMTVYSTPNIITAK